MSYTWTKISTPASCREGQTLASCEWPHPLTQVYHQMLPFHMHHDLKRLASTELRKDCSSINYKVTLLHTDEVFQFDAQKCQTQH